jgi:uncharacterized protein
VIPLIYEERTYRDFDGSGPLIAFRVAVETTDLYIRASRDLSAEAYELVRKGREQVEDAIRRRPEFLKSFSPLEPDPADGPVAQSMLLAGQKAGTGPMAAVAGAIAEFVGRGLLSLSQEIVVENGGDIFLKVSRPITIGVHAGRSPISGKFGLKLESNPIPLGICTSSATVGPSTSLGKADAATVVSYDTALADAAATALGNRVSKPGDLKSAIEHVMKIPGVLGALAIIGDKMAASGDLDLTPIGADSLTRE